jgi:hypothetical protein
MKPSLSPGWETSLTWTQQLAALWSISWPAWVASLLLVAVFASGSGSGSISHANWVSLGGNAVYFGIQLILIRRLVRKNYRSFRIEVVREDGVRTRSLTLHEASRVWLWLLGPQLALFLAASLLAILFASKELPEALRGVSALALWLRILLAGPYGIHLAMNARYPGFRLQAYGYRYR